MNNRPEGSEPFRRVVEDIPPELWFSDEGQITRKPLSKWVNDVLRQSLTPEELVGKVRNWWHEILATNRGLIGNPLSREVSFVVPVEDVFERIKFYFGSGGNSDLPESIEVKRYSGDASERGAASNTLIRSDTVTFRTGLPGKRNIIIIDKIEGDYHQTASISFDPHE